MFTSITDFEGVWNQESASVLKFLETLTNESLKQPVKEDFHTLKRIA